MTMTLHSAIQEVLRAAGHPLTTQEIADAVNNRGLYMRGDGEPLPPSQVSARVRNYPEIFIATKIGIGLVDRTVSEEIATTGVAALTETHTRRSPRIAQGGQRPDDLETALLDPRKFRSAHGIDDEVPDQFGLYAIRVREIDALPEPYRAIARERGSDLIYLGEATRRTLKKRFLGNELRGRGHGTFFRSLGAVLGYRPPAGSLIGKVNQRNYRFSAGDSAEVVKWINANLDVSWVAFEEGVHVAEVALIRKTKPLLNLKDNPAALAELSELRAYCCAIAQGIQSDQALLSGRDGH